MHELKDLVSEVSGIGPKYEKLLSKLEIYTIKDLLYHFPFRYDDFSNIKTVKDVEENDIVTIEGIIGDFQNIYTKNGKRLSKATIVDYTGELPVIWFNQHYLSRVIKKGGWYKLSGKVGIFSNKLTLISPEVEKGKKESLNTGRLVPIYPETSGISSRWIRSRINDILSSKIKIEEILPAKTLEKHDLKGITDSLNQIHFPKNEIESATARKRLAFEELFIELLKVEKRKSEWLKTLKSYVHQPKIEEIDNFIRSLPFVLTESQKISTKEVLEDMRKSHPMNRLLEGDVGTGKTMVAIVTAYFSYINGFKVLYMAPTEILANQHFETFKTYLANLGINIDLKTSSNKKISESWDILIGTHALLFKEEYENIGLVIIDEQHRFGVEQRGKLLKLNKGEIVPHLLTMTATPIPRTLALTIYGDLAISALKEHPNRERKIVTKVVPERQRSDTYNWIVESGEPAFIVCPLIDESESESMENVKAAQAEYENLINNEFKNIEVGLLHGRMKSRDKERVVNKFREGEIKVLISTPVIEVGIDIPDATIIVIESGERYGLASLHQLRGRVGRGDKKGYCFVFLSNYSRNGYSRLKHLETVNNGLELAEIDMKIRGQGDLFGTMQSGFKQFKLASIDDIELLEKAKTEAQEIFTDLDHYPLLINYLNDISNTQIQPN